jgi:lipopolysaccharide export LptBFGC system permease protein LptF
MMKRVPSERMKILVRVGIVVAILLFMALFLLFFLGLISGRIPYGPTMIGVWSMMEILWLFISIKKIRERRKNGRRVIWYTQPSILFALSILFLLAVYIINFVTNAASTNAIIAIIVLLIPSFLFLVASVFFFIKADEPIF